MSWPSLLVVILAGVLAGLAAGLALDLWGLWGQGHTYDLLVHLVVQFPFFIGGMLFAGWRLDRRRAGGPNVR